MLVHLLRCLLFCSDVLFLLSFLLLLFYELLFGVFFFKQKTAYEMRISDWSSDVCSSDLARTVGEPELVARDMRHRPGGVAIGAEVGAAGGVDRREQIGRASCRERVCQYV